MGFYKIGGKKRERVEKKVIGRQLQRKAVIFMYISKNGRKGESRINSVFGLVKMALFNLTFESQTYLLN